MLILRSIVVISWEYSGKVMGNGDSTIKNCDFLLNHFNINPC